MIKRISLLIFILGLCIACNHIEKPKKPKNLIAKNKMVNILFDVFIFNAAKGADKRKLENNNVTPTVYIYEKYQIDSLQFVKSNEYYAYDIKAYESMINKVEERIKTKKAKYQKEIDLKEEQKKKRLDSIKKLGDTLKTEKKPRVFKKD
ncbi:DUF4296 domain-containing protein [Psychroserpens jangbogonensis]|uniref:DUF4296 domain-containing protein n=1 Tax=Psychroserpens jangbogonensis TaxID=1484460 RepID=UPI00068E88D3|nr:DUF4296 domain-containing protein [Psychroserpens jangbogonensis]